MESFSNSSSGSFHEPLKESWFTIPDFEESFQHYCKPGTVTNFNHDPGTNYSDMLICCLIAGNKLLS